MHTLLKQRILRAFALTEDLVAHLDERALALDLAGLPSNRLAGQLWCVVGARESYARSLRAGQWQGFSCSVSEPRRKEHVAAALTRSRDDITAMDFERMTEAQQAFALDLLEHEIQHHGQLIRYVYANGLKFPPSWTERYTV
ncbi:MAG: hypothetical protein ING59_05365 [Burkholderiales bacterium]|nr:hypothetical protein [Burkholderiales bacterium]